VHGLDPWVGEGSNVDHQCGGQGHKFFYFFLGYKIGIFNSIFINNHCSSSIIHSTLT